MPLLEEEIVASYSKEGSNGTPKGLSAQFGVEIKESFLKEADAVCERGDAEELEIWLRDSVKLLRQVVAHGEITPVTPSSPHKTASNAKTDAAIAAGLQDALWKAEAVASQLSNVNRALSRKLDEHASEVAETRKVSHFERDREH